MEYFASQEGQTSSGFQGGTSLRTMTLYFSNDACENFFRSFSHGAGSNCRKDPPPSGGCALLGEKVIDISTDSSP